MSVFKSMVDSLAENGHWASTDLIPPPLTSNLLEMAKSKLKRDLFQEAHVGKGLKKTLAKTIRRDEIFWIDNWEREHLCDYYSILQNIQDTLRKELFLPLKRFEGHFAHYQKGAFYLKHTDRHSVQAHRLLTIVLYLNSVDGGELVIFDEHGQEKMAIFPEPSKLVIFDSALSHEVRPTLSSRFSLTGWFRDDVL